MTTDKITPKYIDKVRNKLQSIIDKEKLNFNESKIIIASKGRLIKNKNDEGFKERMSQIASAHPNSPLADKYKTGESHKKLKTKEVIRKHQMKKPLVTK